jgi:hypothetical protein
LSTGDDNASIAITFNVIVNPVNDAPTLDQPGNVLVDEDSAEQTVELTGITAGGEEIQPISITATSSDSALIADPVVIYTLCRSHRFPQVHSDSRSERCGGYYSHGH